MCFLGCGTSAATESMTTMETARLRTSASTVSMVVPCAFATGITAVVVLVAKFVEGAWVTALLLLAALALNLQLYGGNYLKYHELIPSMAAVTSSAAAMNYRLDARGTIFNDFKEGKISYMDALVLAGEIKHPNDKADTFYL